MEDKLRTKRIHTPIITRYEKSFVYEYPDDEFHLPVIHLQGSPYEIGYAFGILYAERIKQYQSEFGSPLMAMFGGWNPMSQTAPSLEQINLGGQVIYKQAIERCATVLQKQEPNFWQELEGEYDALQKVGSPITWEYIVALACVPESIWIPQQNCSNFAAWGSATKDGKFIHGINLDFESFDVLQHHHSIIIKKPDHGFPFIGIHHTALLCPFSWMNSQGLSWGEMTCDSTHVHWPQIPHQWHGVKVAQEASTIQEAYSILQQTGGTTGWAIIISEGKSAKPYAADIEITGNEHSIRYENPQIPNMIWQTNLFNCYPGYQGYQGINMVKGQMEFFEKNPSLPVRKFIDPSITWKDVNTLEKWRYHVRCPRYERYSEILRENYGNIDLEKAIEIQSDKVLTYDQMPGTFPLSPKCLHLFGIEREIVSRRAYSIYSAIAQPSDGVIWVAAGKIPAQSGLFWRFDLQEHLDLMKKYEK